MWGSYNFYVPALVENLDTMEGIESNLISCVTGTTEGRQETSTVGTKPKPLKVNNKKKDLLVGG